MKNNTYRHLIAALLSCFVQLPVYQASAQQSRAAFLEEVAKPVIEKGWIDFRENNSLNAQTLFTENGARFGLTPNDEMRQFRIQTDEYGFTHFRYQQYHKGIKIIGAETILHHNGMYLKSMNGYIAEQLNLEVQPTISEERGLQLSKEFMNAEIYVYEHPDIAAAISKMSNGQKDFGKPKGELVICRKNWNEPFTESNLSLAYCYRMIILPFNKSADVYIDALTGTVLKSMPLATNCNANTGNTTWYGNKTFNAGYYGWPNNAWLLESHCAGEATMRSLRGDPLVLYNYGDADGSWTDADGVNGYNQRAGVTTYYSIHKAYDYYKNYHGRLSYDNSNGQLDCFSEITGGLWLSDAENASWNTVTHHLSFGADNSSSPTDDWNTLDIVGHEMTHGVHQWCIGNNYSGEPGALDESFADIFGECIEAYAKGTALPDWSIGNDRGAIRSMLSPNIFYCPDTYYGDMWIDPSDPFDNGGVHFNSGIQNYWFYLLVMGGSDTNDNGDAFSVTGIGLNAARNIAYRNMDVYLVSSSGFIDAREGSLRAAQDLFGWCSNEMLQVAKAWYAVGVSIYSPDWNYIVPCGNVPVGMTYRGINSLKTNATCATTILTGQNAIFTSGQAGITFYPGFTATSGCAFTATIDNTCNEAAYNLRTAANENTPIENEDAGRVSSNDPMLVFPNPADDKLSVSFETSENENQMKCSVTDISGKVYMVQPLRYKTSGSRVQFDIDISWLAPGIYMLAAEKDGERRSSKFIITR